MPTLAGSPTRRDLLRVGSLSMVGLSLPNLLALQQAHGATLRPKVDSCIVVFLWGAPSQYETYDPKPDAPDGIRGEFGVQRTNLPGIIYSEHIPQLARRNDRFSIIRTCAQTSTHHQSAAYEALTGYPPSRDAVALTATPGDHPNFGSIVARYAPGKSSDLRFVQLPQLASDVGNLTPGQFAGILGRQFDPLAIQSDPSRADFSIEELSLPADISPARLADRKSLLTRLDNHSRVLEKSVEAKGLSVYQQRAVKMLHSEAVQQAFDLQKESVRLREHYGENTLGQSCLLARRLVEAGVKLVTVCSGFNGKTPQDAWDTHKENFSQLKSKLLPPFDQAMSALLDDLQQRGQLRRTLVVAMGEFGRTPRINKNAGRDHWHHCYSVMLAGGGIRPGVVLGQSDKIGAYPVQGRVCTPGDLCATIYDQLGIDLTTQIIDVTGRPVPLTRGAPIKELY